MIAYAVFSPVEYWPLLAGFLAAVALLLAFDLTVMERLTRMTENAPDAAKRRFRVSLTW
ncbi:MAG: hypothetical protein RLZZ238_360, partial [Planctomycetota bacterium]